MPDFLAEAQELFKYTQTMRRDFHRHPELGFQEVRTAGVVAGELNALGLEVTAGIAETGIRLTNFNVENSCTVSRVALLTARYAIRAGGTQATGMTLWEVTMAEAFQSVGYATGIGPNDLISPKWPVGGPSG